MNIFRRHNFAEIDNLGRIFRGFSKDRFLGRNSSYNSPTVRFPGFFREFSLSRRCSQQRSGDPHRIEITIYYIIFKYK